ncbi:MAG: hypothetical protein COX81_03325 [Candidatus Magasanikbacteria bacterium CG_4_10_14_0_2_um_filter_37_12]|uniref:Uncharacterized protein n=1 Tax=Candidatus Magasanikbacteria bacterium CG_4_10_14_0_2_um_filter_37_12 TaxID=1974637 RepID=A0A2M7V744_9BACT|nr:MAG: hypothetical protein COX81_03325 [Candidatus Magasanikbacteria bacterium CG_4_10_14_0_2_um_filter_37_12]
MFFSILRKNNHFVTCMVFGFFEKSPAGNFERGRPDRFLVSDRIEKGEHLSRRERRPPTPPVVTQDRKRGPAIADTRARIARMPEFGAERPITDKETSLRGSLSRLEQELEIFIAKKVALENKKDDKGFLSGLKRRFFGKKVSQEDQRIDQEIAYLDRKIVDIRKQVSKYRAELHNSLATKNRRSLDDTCVDHIGDGQSSVVHVSGLDSPDIERGLKRLRSDPRLGYIDSTNEDMDAAA